jgi:hypothetical protein
LKVKFLELVRSAFGSQDAKFKQQFSVFLVCLVFSIFIWTSIKLTDDYQAIIEVPVKYTHFPRNKVLVKAADSIIQLKIQEKGTELFRLKYLTRKDTILINLKDLNLTREGKRYEGFLLTSNLFEFIIRHQELSQNLIEISPDTLSFIFEDEARKKIPVIANLSLDFESQFMLADAVKLKPDSVMVRGPSSQIDTMRSARLEKIREKQLNRPLDMTVRIYKDDKLSQVNYQPDRIEVLVPVAKYTESKVEIPINILYSDGKNIKTFPDIARITYQVSLQDFKKVNGGMFQAVADFSKTDFGSGEHRVKIRLVNVPDFIKITRIDPDEAEFIILK